MKENNIELRILEVAEKEFLLKGYAGARTVYIAEKVGVSHSMLHYYYRTKKALFNKIFEAKINQLVDFIIEAFNQPHVSFFDRIEIGIVKSFDFFVQNPNLPRFIINEMTVSPNCKYIYTEIVPIIERSIKGMKEEMADLEKQGHIEKIEISDLILDIISMNVFVFIVPACIQRSIVNFSISQEEFLKHRRKENVEIIMHRLKKQN